MRRSRSRSRSREPARRKRSRSREARPRSRSPQRHRSRSPERKRDRRDSPGGERRRDDSRRWSPERRGGGRERERSRSPRREERRAPQPLPPPPRGGPPLPPPPAGGAGGAGNGVKKVSELLSLEELLKKRAAESAAAAKPVFLSKAQREALAAKEKAEEEAVARRRATEASEHSNRDWARSARAAEERRREEERRRQRDAEREQEKQLEQIKLQYLGKPKEKKKVLKPADKFKFLFDWEPDQDTSRDLNPLYATPHEASLQFGRGLRAGVDRKEAKTAGAEREAEQLARSRAATAAAAAAGAEVVVAADGAAAGPSASRDARAAAAEAERRALAASLAKEDRYERARATPAVPHWSTKSVADMSERDWRIFREDHAITTKGGKLPNPFRTWAEAPLPEPILRAVEKVGYTKPSPIQMAAIPIGVAQRDVIGIAETGSGKTCAFVLPMLAYIMRLPPMAGHEDVEALGPYAVVLSPTRELAQQIEEETVKFAHFLEYRVVSVVGGQSIEEQGFKLRKGCEIVIGTPGRILDCLERRYTVLHQCNFVVLDEADRMIDYGFEPQVISVMDAMPSSNLKPANEEEELEADKIYRTTFMFSATMPPIVERLARKYMRLPAVVTIGSAGKAADLIQQQVIMLRNDDKAAELERLLRAHADTQAIVFVNTHKTCDYIGKVMERMGKPTCVLHGGKTQDAREYAIDGFRSKKYQVLIATDVAGRGIDVPDVGLVVNYQMPSTIEAYTHRIGRTGRAGKKGVAASFVTPEDRDVYYDLKQLLMDSGNVVPPELARHEASRKKPQKGPDFGRNIES